jgi:hypothetical protein
VKNWSMAKACFRNPLSGQIHLSEPRKVLQSPPANLGPRNQSPAFEFRDSEA